MTSTNERLYTRKKNFLNTCTKICPLHHLLYFMNYMHCILLQTTLNLSTCMHACMPCRMASNTPPVFEHAECRDDEDERELLLAPRSDSENSTQPPNPCTCCGGASSEGAATTLNSRYPKAIIGMLLLVVVLFFTTLSKLTLIDMTLRLNSALAREEPSATVPLYWQLLFVIMVPQCITFLRTMMRGVCGRRTATFPWPTFRALLVVSLVYKCTGCFSIKEN